METWGPTISRSTRRVFHTCIKQCARSLRTLQHRRTCEPRRYCEYEFCPKFLLTQSSSITTTTTPIEQTPTEDYLSTPITVDNDSEGGFHRTMLHDSIVNADTDNLDTQPSSYGCVDMSIRTEQPPTEPIVAKTPSFGKLTRS
jgi:hypothetical protein